MKLRDLAALAIYAAVAGGCCRGAAMPGPVAAIGVPSPASAPATSAALGAGELSDVVRAIRPVVVNITSVQAVLVPETTVMGAERSSRRFITFRRDLAGAGFVLDPTHVVTNAHLVADASVIRVRLSDEREVTAHVVGLDPLLDVAVVATDESSPKLAAATLGSTLELAVGDPVIALGNPFGFGHTVTAGIVSAKNRVVDGPLDDFVQTDAAINPGNSGGPLFDRHGRVVGINTSVTMQGHGVGFAIPIDAFREVLPQLLSKGRVDRGQLGFNLQTIDATLAKLLRLESPDGALVAAVDPHGPAERAGFARGDVVLAFEGTKIHDARDLEIAIARRGPGARVALSVRRDGKNLDLTAEVALLELDDPLPVAPAHPKPAGWGVELEDDRGRVVVRDVVAGSVLEGRLERGDLVVEIDRTPIKSARELDRRWSTPGAHLLWIERAGVPLFVGVERR